MTAVVDVNATLCQGVLDTWSLRRSQSEESAERFQRDRTVSGHDRRIEIEGVDLAHEKSELVLAADAQAVLGAILLGDTSPDDGGARGSGVGVLRARAVGRRVAWRRPLTRRGREPVNPVSALKVA